MGLVRSYHLLSAEERNALLAAIRKQQKSGHCSVKSLAKELGRSRATIDAELHRGQPKQTSLADCLNNYNPLKANTIAQESRKNCHPKGKIDSKTLKIIRDCIVNKHFSPDQIVNAVLKQDDNPPCIDTIYRMLHKEEYKDIRECLRHKGKRRKNGDGRISRRFDGCKGLEDRPDGCNQRTEFGHLEFDTVESPKKKGGGSPCLFTAVDRKTRHLFAFKSDTKDTDGFIKALQYVFKQYPKGSIKSITADRGSEFSNWKEVEQIFKVPVYFCLPHHPWEKGSNENTNKLIREFFPKKTDFGKVTQRDVYFKCIIYLHNRPREILNYQTTLDRFKYECYKFNYLQNEDKKSNTSLDDSLNDS